MTIARHWIPLASGKCCAKARGEFKFLLCPDHDAILIQSIKDGTEEHFFTDYDFSTGGSLPAWVPAEAELSEIRQDMQNASAYVIPTSMEIYGLPPCKNCSVPIMWDGAYGWMHTSKQVLCRNTAITVAEPPVSAPSKISAHIVDLDGVTIFEGPVPKGARIYGILEGNGQLTEVFFAVPDPEKKP